MDKIANKETFAVLLSVILVISGIVVMPAIALEAHYPLSPDDTKITKALDYLRDAQSDDGDIGSFGTSAWVVMAIAAAGEDPHEWKTVPGNPSIVDYLKNNSGLINPDVATDWERSILAIVAAGEDPTNFGGIDYVAGLKNLWDSDNNQMDEPNLWNDDFWGILALVAAGENPTSEMIQGSAAYIKNNQNVDDGGWSWGVGGDSDVDDTDAAIMALIAAGESPSSVYITNAMDYLRMEQDDYGGFAFRGYEVVNSASTSWAIDAIVAVGQDPTGEDWTWDDNPVNVLLSFQDPNDGSFWWTTESNSGSAWMTAYALPALLGKPYPAKPTSVIELDSNWHQFQKDEINTGITYTSAPTKYPELAWSAFTYGSEMGNGIDVTPIIAGDMVYVYAANGSIWAFDKTSGDLIWMNETTGGNLQTSTPAYGNGKIFVAANNGDLFAFNATTGKELWSVQVTDRNFECPITYFDHKIYIGEGLEGGVTTKYYYCYDENGTPLWSHATPNTAGFLWCGASVVGDYLVYATHEGKLISLYRNNGTLTDEVDLTSASYLSFSRSDLGKIRASVTYHDGYVYTTSEKGQPIGYVWKVGFDADNGTFIDSGWSTPNGFSTSTPVVHDGKVYVGQGEHGFTGNLTCINDSTGEIIWQYPVSGGVKSSPAISIQGGKPYIYFTASKITADNGSLYCLGENGTLAWEYNPPDDAYILQGAAISDGFVYFGTDEGYIYCIKAKTTPSPEDWEQFHMDARHTGFSNSTAPDTNNTLWISDDISAVASSSPVVGEGKVFVNCGDTLKALNKSTGALLWSTPIAGSTVMGSWLSPSYHAGKVFMSGLKVYCIDATNGTIIWEYGLSSTACNGGTVVTDGKVFAGDWDGHHYYCLDEETGEELWNFTVSGYAQGTAAFADGKVYFTSWVYGAAHAGHIYCVDADTGEEIWHQNDVPENCCGSPTIYNDFVYVTTFNFYGDGDIYALDKNNGSILWNQTIQRTDSTPAVAYGNVYVCGGCAGYSDVQTYCFNATTGNLIWNTTASDGIGGWTHSVAVADGKVFVGKPSESSFGYTGTYVLGAFTGDTIWSYPEGGSSPAIADEMVFTIGGGKVYAFGGATIAKPELVPTSITPTTLYVNQSNAITAIIRNTGTATAGQFNVSLKIKETIIDNETVASLAAGNSTDLVFTWIPTAIGTYNLTVIVDSENAIGELNETNNNLTKNIMVKEQSDWPQFHRDVKHTGFSPSDAPNTSYTAWISENIGAQVGSSVAIEDGRIFVYCVDYLVCIDEYTGEIIWNVSIERTLGVCCSWITPAYHDGNVFLSANKTYCFNATDGSEVWNFTAPTGKGAVDGGVAIADAKVFTSDWDGGHYYCLAEATGNEIWNVTVNGTAQSTPAVSVEENRVFFGSWAWGEGGYIYCVDLDTGSKIWNISTEASPCGSAAVKDDILYMTTYNFTSNGDLYAIYTENGTILWQQKVQRTDVTPAIAYGNVYVSGGCDGFSDLQTYCFNATTGELIWSTAADQDIGDWKCSVAVADGKVFVGKPNVMEYAGTYALDAFTGDIIWNSSKGGSSPAISNGMIFTIADGRVYCFAEKETLWDGYVTLESGTFDITPHNNLTANYTVNRTTALGALDAAAEKGGFNYTVSDEWYTSYGSFLVDSIADVENTATEYWMYWVNYPDEPMPGVGANLYELDNGDVVTFYYGGMSTTPDNSSMVVRIRVNIQQPVEGYPMFHYDPQRTGNVSGDAPITNDTLWSTSLGGFVGSSPIVSDGRVYVSNWEMGAGDYGLYCLDEQTGTIIWKNPLNGGDGTASTAAISGDRIFVGSKNGYIYCINASNGTTIWNKRIETSPAYWGVASSPLIYDEKVFVNSWSDGTLHVFDFDGTEMWNISTENGIHYYTSPAAVNGKVFFAGNGTSHALYCADLLTHDVLWTFNTGKQVTTTPAIWNDKVFFATKGQLYSVSTSGNKIWNRSINGAYSWSSPAISDGRIYIGSKDDKTVYCYDASNGNEIWSATINDPVDSSPVVANGTVYFGTSPVFPDGDGKIYALNATDGSEIWCYRLIPPAGKYYNIMSSPAIADGILFIGADDGCVHAFGTWKTPSELTSIEVSPEMITLNIGDTQQFTATAKDQYGNEMYGIVFDWTSSNETVGTINNTGFFTANGAGITTIKALNGTVNGTAEVMVNPASAVTITFADLTPTGTRGNYVIANATVSGNAGTYTIVVSGTGTTTGYPLAGIGVVVKGSEDITVPILAYIPASVNTETYALYAGLYDGTTIAVDPIMVSGPKKTAVS